MGKNTGLRNNTYIVQVETRIRGLGKDTKNIERTSILDNSAEVRSTEGVKVKSRIKCQ